ncbi:rhomboid family intramembrane serine protease [Allosaccharopolyspora coralli]|uniref:Rhomboid family intramembrane serine protease n=1 Tax=Allosaccharopolyspora coralli TaxID=2665642 RepID=A0A5Q3QBZ0_9PSEU|nr:rhomboid family intramembrane serine protease [Allosaccharopolyspora coralli]QGK72068.1 rhomboid family intramembrane serine protease [Allosaccharopolyspora coralli]
MSPSSENRSRVIPAKPVRSALLVVLFVVGLYVIEFYDAFFLGQALNREGIFPRQVDGLDGILWAPLLHGDFAHLGANTVPLLVLGWLVMAGGLGQFVGVTATIWLLGGLGTWLIGFPAPHIGASGLVFGWMVFLLMRGFFARSVGQIVVAIVLFLYWGGILWGVLPGQPGVSWEGHLFGALAGALAAYMIGRQVRDADPWRPGRLSG